MNSKENYIIYIANNCHDCAYVSSSIKDLEGLDIRNVDEGEGEPPVYIAAYPALFKNGELKAYGADINDYLSEATAK